MILNATNIGAISIAGTIFGWHAFEYTCNYGYVRSTSSLRLLSPGRGDVSGLTLTVDGPIWIDAAVLTDFDTFFQGGYLETITRTLTYAVGDYDTTSGTWTETDSDSITFSYLGLRPAAYSGGLRLSNLTTPAADDWDNISTSYGYRKRNRAASFLLNNRLYYIWNHQTDYYQAISGTWYRSRHIFPGMICTGLAAGPANNT